MSVDACYNFVTWFGKTILLYAVIVTLEVGTAAQAFDPGCQVPFHDVQGSHDLDSNCGINGTKRDGGQLSDAKKAENEAKNNFCAPGQALPISLTTFLKLQGKTNDVRESDLDDRSSSLSDLVTVAGRKYGEGKVVRYVAFVIHAKYSNVKRSKNDMKFGESVNCYRPSNEENDIHIMLGQSRDDEPCSTVTAEMSPHFRPLSWTPENLEDVRQHPVRIIGQLFFDSSHKPCKNGKGSPARASVWEIHPIYSIDVCRKTALQACKVGPASIWMPLNEWFGEEHESDE
jgi:hypothetical protein